MLNTTLTTLINRLDSKAVSGTDVIDWCCPVPSFGDISKSKVATVGINPSNREFVDQLGDELVGKARRFHTLNSLSLDSWADVDFRHLRYIIESCTMYFLRNPYDRWFKVLDQVVWGTNTSFYTERASACHLDIIPYATARKWTELPSKQKSKLLGVNSDTLGILLRDSPIRILILNGRTVLTKFEELSGLNLDARKMPSWSLSRKSGPDVVGVSYTGFVSELAGIDLGRGILVLGFNHNLQSSYGMTTSVLRAIRTWVAAQSVKCLNNAPPHPKH